MRENRDDDPAFFEKYAQMSRSRLGLADACFLGDRVVQSHRTLTSILVATIPGMRDELRRR